MADNSEFLSTMVNPQFRNVLESKLQDGEQLIALADAFVPPFGQGATWLPFVGSMIELGRAAGTKPYVLVVTSTRLWIIGVNKRFTKSAAVQEKSFEFVPINDIRSSVTDSRFFDGLIFKDALKFSLMNGKKYEFRLNKEKGDIIRDAIISSQEGVQA